MAGEKAGQEGESGAGEEAEVSARGVNEDVTLIQ